MKFTLLTHYKELEKRSNTGRLVLDVLGSAAEQVRWDRIEPPAEIVSGFEAGSAVLIYPGAPEETDADFTGVSQCVLIDGTWQQARKIFQRSPYLRNVRRICLTPEGESRYNLRKNQKKSCLCTVECVIQILQLTGQTAEAERLEELFLSFIRPPGAMRGEVQGH